LSYNNTINALVEQGFKGTVWHPGNFNIYMDNPRDDAKEIQYKEEHEIMNVEKWGRANGLLPEQKANAKLRGIATQALEDDPLLLVECFNGKFADLANDMFTTWNHEAKVDPRGLATAIITHKDYSVLQTAIVLGESTHPIVQGVLTRFWDEVAAPNLRGDWNDITRDVVFHTNVPDGQGVEPSKGSAKNLISVVVPKHQGAVEITDRARANFNFGRNVYAELSAALGEKRLVEENKLVAKALDGTTNTDGTHGLDFGARTGTPPYSQYIPADFFQYFIDAATVLGIKWDQIATANIVFNEYKNNTWNLGFTSGLSSIEEGQAVGPTPGYTGVTWYRDFMVASATKAWLANRDLSGRIFRGPIRQYQIYKEDDEKTKTTLKSYVIPRRLDDTYLIEISGMSA